MQPTNPNDPSTPTSTHTESVRDREVIVTGNERSSSSAIIAIVALLAFALIAWLAVTNLSSGDVVPDDVNVNVEDNSGAGDTNEAPAAETDTSDEEPAAEEPAAEEPAPAETTAP